MLELPIKCENCGAPLLATLRAGPDGTAYAEVEVCSKCLGRAIAHALDDAAGRIAA
jgi:hypothetical protein